MKFRCGNSRKFKIPKVCKPKLRKIKYKLTKFGSDQGTYYTEFNKTHNSWVEDNNLSIKILNATQDSRYDRMSKGIPSGNKRAFSICSKPQFSQSLRRSLLRKGQLRNRNRSLVQQWTSGGGSVELNGKFMNIFENQRRSI